jgi:hypothetical protein
MKRFNTKKIQRLKPLAMYQTVKHKKNPTVETFGKCMKRFNTKKSHG